MSIVRAQGCRKGELHCQNPSTAVSLLLPLEAAASLPLPQGGLCSVGQGLLNKLLSFGNRGSQNTGGLPTQCGILRTGQGLKPAHKMKIHVIKTSLENPLNHP